MRKPVNPHAEEAILNEIKSLKAEAGKQLYQTVKLFQLESKVSFLYRMLQAERMVGKYFMTGHSETFPETVIYFYEVNEMGYLSYVAVDADSIAHFKMTLEELAESADNFLPCSEEAWVTQRDRMITRHPL